jgi:CPA2 family monovalent cation:H+ antiporter-2
VPSIVQDLVVLYALAFLFLLVLGRVGAPAIVSLILTGMVAGPGGLGLVGSEESVARLSEVGVALLLFMVGLDVPFGDLGRLWRGVALGGGAQLATTMALAAPATALLFGAKLDTVVFVALFVAMSSTSIVVRELTRRNELHAPHGSLALGILLLQDMAAVAALVLAPVLLGTSAVSLGRALLQIVVIAAALTAATRFVLPVLFRLATTAGREAFGLIVVVASVGTAWLASVLGLSMTVGAFLAGLVIDETEFSHQIHAEIRPLRDLLTSLFFVSVGLLVQPVALLPALPAMVALATGIVVIKTAGALAALRLVGTPLRVAATAALGLAQIGEFSFVVGSEAVAHGSIDISSWQILLGASVLTMMASPALVEFAPRFGAWVGDRRAESSTGGAAVETLSGHVVILGFGVGGRLIARALGALDVPFVVLELNGAAVQQGVRDGLPILYGDATAAEPLKAAGVSRATAVVAVLSDPGATARAVRVVRSLSPRLPVIVRTRYRVEAARMNRAGATLAVAEELEGSLEVAAQLLARLDVPGNVIEELIGEARETEAAPSSRIVVAPAPPVGQMAGAIPETPIASHALSPGDWAVGRTLAGVDLRARTGATILAIRRDRATHAPPSVGWELAPADVLYILGDPGSLRKARAYLAHGQERGQ